MVFHDRSVPVPFFGLLVRQPRVVHQLQFKESYHVRDFTNYSIIRQSKRLWIRHIPGLLDGQLLRR